MARRSQGVEGKPNSELSISSGLPSLQRERLLEKGDCLRRSTQLETQAAKSLCELWGLDTHQLLETLPPYTI